LDKIKKTKICDTGIYGANVKENQGQANLIFIRTFFILF